MDRRFKSKDIRIIVIDPLAQRRIVINEVLKELGFVHVTGFKNGKEALGYLEAENVDWIIMSLMEQGEINALQILKLITEDNSLRHTRSSLLIDESEAYCLSMAYELGLMSHHVNANIRDVILAEFQNLLNEMVMNDFKTVLLSAQYLSKFLKQNKMHESLLKFQESLLDLYPGKSQVLGQLAEALFLNNRPTEAEAVLQQIQLIDATYSSQVTHLREQYGVFDDPELNFSLDGEAEVPSQTRLNTLGVRNCIIVDPDSTVVFFIEKNLRKAGVENILTFESGAKAWAWISSHPEPHVVIQEWRIPDLPGPMLLQRLRQHGFIKTMVIVVSSLIKQQEIPLLREMGVADAIAKPFDPETFFASLIGVLQQDRYPTEQKSLENKIRILLKNNQLEEAERLNHELRSLSDTAPALINEIDAEFSFVRGEYQLAIEKATDALRSGGNSLLLLDLLGRALVKMGDFESALKAFQKAYQLSPLNVERICSLALAEAELGNYDVANQNLEMAKNLDHQAPIVKESECSISLLGQNFAKAKMLMGELDSITKILGYMNNRAVALARCSRFEDGITIYKDILAALPERHDSLALAVTYNLGLAYARYGDLTKALDILSSIDLGRPHPLQLKVKSLIQRIQVALSKGTSLNLSTASVRTVKESCPEESMPSTSHQKVFLTALEINKGSLCCFRVYKNPDRCHPKVIKMLEQDAAFRRREAVRKAS